MPERLGWPKDVAKLTDERNVDGLIAILRDRGQTYDTPRIHAAWGLGEIGDRRAVEPLLATFTDETEDYRMRNAAADALGEIGDPRAIDPLTRVGVGGLAGMIERAEEAIQKIRRRAPQ